MKCFVQAGCLAAAGFLGQAVSAETVFDCDIKVFTNNGWIAPRVMVLWDDSTKTAKVYDGYIHQLVGEPLSAKVEHRKGNSYDLAWRVNDIPVSNARTKVDGLYSAVFDMDKSTLSIRGVITGFANAPRGRGKCKVQQG
ncbi:MULTISPECIES: hypothetical protein [Leisingera]|jgi:hypothetical protein|uniref:hypothetical protein n=1 Tax=Leisingera TaxID=191028 RepID=UPI0011548273|nr:MULTISPECIES: hypothetical protein [Leisingera]QDI76044.1 hypothetical protein R2C4_09900 [Leisingera aquaemixtae]